MLFDSKELRGMLSDVSSLTSVRWLTRRRLSSLISAARISMTALSWRCSRSFSDASSASEGLRMFTCQFLLGFPFIPGNIPLDQSNNHICSRCQVCLLRACTCSQDRIMPFCMALASCLRGHTTRSSHVINMALSRVPIKGDAFMSIAPHICPNFRNTNMALASLTADPSVSLHACRGQTTGPGFDGAGCVQSAVPTRDL